MPAGGTPGTEGRWKRMVSTTLLHLKNSVSHQHSHSPVSGIRDNFKSQVPTQPWCNLGRRGWISLHLQKVGNTDPVLWERQKNNVRKTRSTPMIAILRIIKKMGEIGFLKHGQLVNNGDTKTPSSTQAFNFSTKGPSLPQNILWPYAGPPRQSFPSRFTQRAAGAASDSAPTEGEARTLHSCTHLEPRRLEPRGARRALQNLCAGRYQSSHRPLRPARPFGSRPRAQEH